MSQFYQETKTRDIAIARCQAVTAEWRTKVLGYARPITAKLSVADRRALRALLGLRAYSGPILASDLTARRKFGITCAEVVHSYSVRGQRSIPPLRWFHVTLIDDKAQSLEREPYLNLKQLKAKAYKELQELRLHGLMWVDVDALPNFPQAGQGGTLMFHVHAVAFTDRDFDLRAARQKLKRSRSWSCSLGAPATKIGEITPKLGTPGFWAQYDAKPPYRAKRRKELPDGRVKLRWTREGYRPHVALRLTEGLAQMALMDTFSAVGEGKELREEIRKRLMKWHRRRWPDLRRIDIISVEALFRRVWALKRVTGYVPWFIIGTSV